MVVALHLDDLSMSAQQSAAQTHPDNLMWRIAAGALIPAFATIIFNGLAFIIENFHAPTTPPVQQSVFDFSAGCAFSLVGLGVAIRDRAMAAKIFVVFVILLLTILGSQVGVVMLEFGKSYVIWTDNTISLFVLSWAIYVAE
jgi:hypothetical protein